jgi:gas vesicle protein
MAAVSTPESGVTDQAADKAQQVAGQAKEKAQEAAGEAKGRVREQVDQRSTEAGKQVSTASGDLRSVSDELRKQGKDAPARLADQAADRAERLGSYLTESDADRILHDVEDLARRQPWAVVAGGLLVGFAASRFLKASSTQRYQQKAVGSVSSTAHTSPQLGHPAGNGVRSDRDIGGPTAPPTSIGTATGGATGTPPPTGLGPH